MAWLNHGLAIGGCLLAIGCGNGAPIETTPSIYDKLDQHMAAASRWCGVRDWRSLFSASVVGARVRLAWQVPAPAGQPHPRAKEGRCILDTFGTIAATDTYFEIDRTALRTSIVPRLMD